MAIQSQFYSENFGFDADNRGVVCQDNMYGEHGFGFESELNVNLQQQQKQPFMEFQPQQQHQFQFMPRRFESLCSEKNVFTPNYANQSLNLSSTISAVMEKQRQEIDQFLSVQVIIMNFEFCFGLLYISIVNWFYTFRRMLCFSFLNWIPCFCLV